MFSTFGNSLKVSHVIFDWAKTEKATMATYNWCVAYSVQVILFYQFHVLKLHAEIKIKK